MAEKMARPQRFPVFVKHPLGWATDPADGFNVIAEHLRGEGTESRVDFEFSMHGVHYTVTAELEREGEF